MLLAVALLSAGTIPYALQRFDFPHVLFASFIPLGFTVVGLVTLLQLRGSEAWRRWIAPLAATAVLTSVIAASLPFVRDYFLTMVTIGYSRQRGADPRLLQALSTEPDPPMLAFDEILNDVLAAICGGVPGSDATVSVGGVSVRSYKSEYAHCVAQVGQLATQQYPDTRGFIPRVLGFGTDGNAARRAEATMNGAAQCPR